ncbi:MAG: hypothetical protein QOC81_1072 [Thermoanaerobaculia bacterium]|jgi:hypothetical protein|nr:hypothetical protein [Thermoanaerobaculia bacterium]
MSAIDIPISAELQALMKVPSAAEIRLPKPVDLKITLPTGAVLKAPNDISKGSPTPASASFGLLLQLGPLLGSLECLLKILKLLKPLIDVIKGLPFPPVKAIKDFVLAAKDLIPCFGVVLPTSLIPFIKDILCLIHSMLQGIHDGLKSVADVIESVSSQMAAADESGNDELKKVLEAAQENAMTSASQFTAALAPLSALLTMVEPIMSLAGLQPFKLPEMGEAADAAALKQVVGALEGAIDALGNVTQALGGCS